MDALWTAFGDAYGHRWVRGYGPVPSATWLRALGGLSDAQIQRGCERALSQWPDWPPALGEFVRSCLPTAPELGMPEPGDAYRAAVRRHWSHPCVWLAANAVGHWELANHPERVTRPAFDRAYAALLARAQRGERFADPPPPSAAAALPETVAMTPEMRARGRAALSALRGGLGARSGGCRRERPVAPPADAIEQGAIAGEMDAARGRLAVQLARAAEMLATAGGCGDE